MGSVRGRFGIDFANLGESLGIYRNFVRVGIVRKGGPICGSLPHCEPARPRRATRTCGSAGAPRRVTRSKYLQRSTKGGGMEIGTSSKSGAKIRQKACFSRIICISQLCMRKFCTCLRKCCMFSRNFCTSLRENVHTLRKHMQNLRKSVQNLRKNVQNT